MSITDLSYPGHVSKYTADTILSTLSLPPKMRVVINYEPDNSDNGRQYSDECIDNGVCENEAHNEILDESTDRCWEDLGLSTSEQQEGLPPAETSVLVIPVPCDGKENKKRSLIHCLTYKVYELQCNCNINTSVNEGYEVYWKQVLPHRCGSWFN